MPKGLAGNYLHYAIIDKIDAVTKKLVKPRYGLNVKMSDPRGWPPLHTVAWDSVG